MSDANYPTDLLRLVASQLYLQNLLTVSRDMFGKPYFALGLGEKDAVDKTTLQHIDLIYRYIGPDFFRRPEPSNPVGFGIPKPDPAEDPAKK